MTSPRTSIDLNFDFQTAFAAFSAAALNNKPEWFIRQVFRSKLFWRSKLAALPEQV